MKNLTSAIEKTLAALCAKNTVGENTDNYQETDSKIYVNDGDISFSVVCRNGEGGVYGCGDMGGSFQIANPLKDLIEANLNLVSTGNWTYIPYS